MTTLAFPGTDFTGTDFTGTDFTGTDFTSSPARTRPGLHLVQLHDELWRVTRPSGEVLGYVERFGVRAGPRFRAKRFIVRQRRFVEMGEFWSMDDAVDCFGF
jgi:hypothetical protein